MVDLNGHSPIQGLMEDSELEELLVNAYTSRKALLDRFYGGDDRRDLYKECRFPKDPEPKDYEELYAREALFARAINLWPEEAYRVLPTVYDKERSKRVTGFEQSWDEFCGGLAQEETYYKDEKGSALWGVLKQLDVEVRKHRYGVLFIGYDDGEELSAPVKKAAGRKVLYLRPLGEPHATISKVNRDKSSKRYMLPEQYSLTFAGGGNLEGIGAYTGGETFEVHWSRVLHVTRESKNPLFSAPYGEQILNHVLSARKAYYAANEGFWQCCFAMLVLESNPSAKIREIPREKLRAMMQRIRDGLQKDMALANMTAKTLAPSVLQPDPFIAPHKNAICIRLQVPMRIFEGSERGELASGDDKDGWNVRVAGEHNSYYTPKYCVPLANRLIATGVCKPPDDSVKVWWPDVSAPTKANQADVAAKRVGVIATYIEKDVAQYMTPHDLYTRELGYSDEEATAVLEAAEEEQAQRDEEEFLPFAEEVPADDEFTENKFCGTGKGGGVDPTCKITDKGGAASNVASDAERVASLAKAQAKITTAPIPAKEKVAKMRAALERAKTDPKARAGGDARGSAASRRARARALFAEFGGNEKGYVVCPWTGLKMHWSTDPKENPKGYPKFEQGKIFTACQGGGYQLPNLLPESFTANRSRNDKRLRSENSKGCK